MAAQDHIRNSIKLNIFHMNNNEFRITSGSTDFLFDMRGDISYANVSKRMYTMYNNKQYTLLTKMRYMLNFLSLTSLFRRIAIIMKDSVLNEKKLAIVHMRMYICCVSIVAVFG